MNHITAERRLLVIDDDDGLRELLIAYLSKQGYVVHGAESGAAMRAHLAAEPVDLVILDIMLPGESGLDLCKELIRTHNLPILMISANGAEVDRIVGLEVGADHYLPKPFSPRELLAHVRSLLRRGASLTETRAQRRDVLAFGSWQLDLNTHNLLDSDGVTTPLSPGEFRLLKELVLHANQVLSRDTLMDALSGRPAEAYDRTIDTLVSRLRRRLRDDARAPAIIKTVRAGGYLLVSNDTPPR